MGNICSKESSFCVGVSGVALAVFGILTGALWYMTDVRGAKGKYLAFFYISAFITFILLSVFGYYAVERVWWLGGFGGFFGM